MKKLQPAKSSLSSVMQERLGAIFRDAEARNGSGLVALAFENSKHGIDLNFSKDQTKKFFAASVTKMFTATALLKLAEAEVLSLDDSISKYLTTDELNGLVFSKNRDISTQLTIRKLAMNQSGIPDYYQAKRLEPRSDIAQVTANDPGWSFHDALEIAKKLPTASKKVKSHAHYSFTNFQILSEIIERSTGKSLSQVLDEQVIKPFELANTFLFTKGDKSLSETISPLRYGNQSYLGFLRMASLRGEGALVSTASDLITFLKHINQLGSSRSLLQTMAQNAKPLYPFVQYSLGLMRVRVPWFVMASPRTPKLLGHFGATGSFAFFEETTGSYCAGTVNQLGNPRAGSSFMFKIFAEAMKILPKD